MRQTAASFFGFIGTFVPCLNKTLCGIRTRVVFKNMKKN